MGQDGGNGDRVMKLEMVGKLWGRGDLQGFNDDIE